MVWPFTQKPPAAKSASYSLDSPALMNLMMRGEATSLNAVGPDTAMRLSTVYACIKVLSETVSTLPCHLFKLSDDRATKSHAWGDALHSLVNRSPNDWQTSQEFWQQQMVNLCLRGNSYNYIVRAGSSGRVVAIHPLPVDAVSVNVYAQNRIEYSVTVGEKGEQRSEVFQPDEILHFKTMSMDGIRGVSPISYQGHLLGGSIEARNHANNVFANGSTPRGVLMVDGTLSDEAYANLKESWSSSHAGTQNANKVALLEAGVKFEPISMSPGDVQLIETRKMSREEICGMFRVPPHMVADLSRATFSNITEQSMDFYRSAISPYLKTFESRMNFSFLGDSTREFKFDVSELIRGDFSGEVDAYKKLLEIGVMSPNEVRGRLDMNPRDGGDDFVSDSNNLTFGDEAEGTPDEPEQPEQTTEETEEISEELNE
ncbi:MAG: HK97 family phage portal protein [Alteromonas macleodii]|jgi:HK97 family phage portal protein|tara:strand:- start:1952 stop:3238 length:1287 start_codon:yes stop_codon:yes gene_type:complete